MPITANSLTGFLAVYAQESLKAYIANMPPINLFTKNFDSSIANGGTSVTTRIPTTVYGAANDLAVNGWAGTAASSSAVTATLGLKSFDHIFNELEVATLTPQMLQNTYLPVLVKQLANSIVVDAINNVTSSVFPNTLSPVSSSAFTVTGSTSLQAAATALSNAEIQEEGRYFICTPNVRQALTSGILPTYYFGDSGAIKLNKVQELMGFQLFPYARMYGAAKPYGGSSYGSADKLIGFAGVEQGLVAAVRQPVEINNGLVQSATAVDETSGLSIQVRWVYDVSKPAWRLAVVSCYGTAAGNPKAIIPVLTQSV